MLKKVVFLDRDGVINRDSPEHIKSWDEFEFLPGSLEAISLLTRGGFTIIVITNQSAIGRGMVAPETLSHTHRRMSEAVAAHGGNIRDIFFCPHHPDDGCDCRKPMPGLILKALDTHDIDLSDAVMVGDSAKDIECARNAGCGANVLVRTGNGPSAATALAEKGIRPDYQAADLLDAAHWILKRERP
jgi:D-glycero-D-manno-heptose 1,7-bisphosphate phosphatase